MKKYEYSKKALEKVSVETLNRWINEQEEISESDNIFSLIDGILKDKKGKTSSVGLQHSAKKLWVK